MNNPETASPQPRPPEHSPTAGVFARAIKIIEERNKDERFKGMPKEGSLQGLSELALNFLRADKALRTQVEESISRYIAKPRETPIVRSQKISYDDLIPMLRELEAGL